MFFLKDIDQLPRLGMPLVVGNPNPCNRDTPIARMRLVVFEAMSIQQATNGVALFFGYVFQLENEFGRKNKSWCRS